MAKAVAPKDLRSLQARAQEAFDLEQRILERTHQVRNLWILLAQDLWTFNKQALFKDLGYTSFQEWCGSHQMSYSYIQSHIGVWDVLVERKGVDPKELEGRAVTTFEPMLPALRRGEVTVEEALGDAAALSRSDIRIKYETLKSHREGTLDASTTVEVYRCEECGSLVRRKPVAD